MRSKSSVARALRLERRIDGRLKTAGLRRTLDFRLDDASQQRARFSRVGTETLERAVELEQVHRDLLHLRLLGLVGSVSRRDEKCGSQRRHRRDEPHHELHPSFESLSR